MAKDKAAPAGAPAWMVTFADLMSLLVCFFVLIISFSIQDEQKLQVARARRIERFLSQPFHVAEQFTSIPGTYVPIGETIRGFREIVEGKHDELPENAFYMKGGIDEAVESAEKGAGS